MSTTIVTRATKGGRLSFSDMDTNLLNLQSTADSAAPQVTTYTKSETDGRIQAIVGAAPTALDTLVEIAAQLASDESAAGALTTAVSLKAPIASPTFTGTVSGITKAMVGLGSVDNTTDADKPVSTAMQTALDLKANQVTTYTKTQVDAAIASATPSFSTLTGKPTTIAGYGITDGMTAAAISTAIGVETTRATAAEALKAPLTSPTLVTPNIGVATGTSLSLSGDMNVTGNVFISGTSTKISSTNLAINDPMIYLGEGNVGNVSDVGIIGSINTGTEQHTGFVKDATDGVWKLFSGVIPEPTATVDFTGATYDALKVGSITATTFTGITKAMVGLGSVDNTSDADKPVSTATVTAIGVETSRATAAEALKAPLASPTFTGTVSGITKAMVGLGSVDNTSDAAKPVSTATTTAIGVETSRATAAEALKAPLASPTFTGTVSGITKAMVGLGSVDNTTDADKPVSTAMQAALDLKANLTGATFTGDVVAPNFNSNSDRNLKENISKIETASDIIAQLDGVSFTWKDSGVKTFGFIAQEVEEIIPELIGKNDELGTLTVNYQGIIPFLVEALKEQAARIAVLESK